MWLVKFACKLGCMQRGVSHGTANTISECSTPGGAEALAVGLFLLMSKIQGAIIRAMLACDV